MVGPSKRVPDVDARIFRREIFPKLEPRATRRALSIRWTSTSRTLRRDHRAGLRAGIMSSLMGISSYTSIETGGKVKLRDLVPNVPNA